ncbi:MAG: hypothetical protein HYY17_01175 [Planctomycetes bacterium]|nr:hypothetical protein [Planctomycetota bacterium]
MRVALSCLLPVLLSAAPAQEDPLERLLRAIERRHASTPDPSDVRLAAGRLGFDRARILRFVREQVGYEPYEGILRDAEGTLLARSGNSLDRSLLLLAMLEAGGERVRLVRADLTEEEGKRLLDHFAAQDPLARLAEKGADLRSVASEIGVDETAVRKLFEQRRREEAALVAEIREAAEPEASRLLETVGGLAAAAVRIPRIHYWVEARDEAKNRWEALDPSPVGFAKREGRPVGPRDLAAERRQILFRLILHRRIGEKAEAAPLLSVSFDPAAIAWRPVDLLLEPSEKQLPEAKNLAAMDAGARTEALARVRIFRPGLIVDGRPYGGAPFDLDGGIYKVDAHGHVGAVSDFGGAVGDKFSDPFGEGEKKPATKLDRLVWEVEVREPGVAPRIHRREILPGDAGKGVRALPVLRWSFLVEPAPMRPGDRARRALNVLGENAAVLRSVFLGNRQGHVNLRSEVSALLLRFSEMRRRLLVTLLEGRRAVGFRDRLNLFVDARQMFLDESRREIRIRRTIDIMENAVAFATPDGKTDPATALRAGVMDTVLEALLLSRAYAADSSATAWTLLERARIVGAKAEVPAGDRRKELGIRADDRLAVCRPVDGRATAWWSVDPATGSCVGRVPSGAGQAAVEHAWHIAHKVCEIAEIFRIVGESGAAGHTVHHIDEIVTDACSVVNGTWPRRIVEKKMNEMVKRMWAEATDALAGVGGGE